MAMASVLIVEDDDALYGLMKLALEREGHQISRARDGLEGLAQAQNSRFDVILMDMRLPEMAGWEVTQRLKAEQTTPIIGLSAGADLERKAIEAGCDDFLLKPFLPSTLQALVKKFSH
jgi:two-component system, OmpR family, response regulator ResD